MSRVAERPGSLIAASRCPATAIVGAACLALAPALAAQELAPGPDDPYVMVLGVAQDGGVPQAGQSAHPGWEDPERRRLVVSLAVVDPVTSERWLFDVSPDFPRQLHRLDEAEPVDASPPALDGIFLTHAHVGHYTGLMHLGHEVMGARGVPVHAMPRMREFLEGNGPWDQLVRFGNIDLRPLRAGEPVRLNRRLTVTSFRVPHRQEYSEVVGFRIEGPSRSVLYLPDIDSWEEWEARGTAVEEVVAGKRSPSHHPGAGLSGGPGERDDRPVADPSIPAGHAASRARPYSSEIMSMIRFITCRAALS